MNKPNKPNKSFGPLDRDYSRFGDPLNEDYFQADSRPRRGGNIEGWGSGWGGGSGKNPLTSNATSADNVLATNQYFINYSSIPIMGCSHGEMEMKMMNMMMNIIRVITSIITVRLIRG
ncbi:MAG: hypothetical protein EZS28_024603 [Streblomastix strix]|uniref:Uncharacterized protein n=1 Tax=Streblomastix strix TaxID=222440 RepID=A0A5J4VBH6_9EUKA|nr:MAG: hypothetical protein EZS28_024603 [Streblomastix strix]